MPLLLLLTSLHYLVKRGCSKFLPNTGFITIIFSDLVSQWRVKRAYCCDNFLAWRPLSGVHIVPGLVFLCFNRTAPQGIENTTLLLSWSERETRETRRRLSACVHVHDTHLENEVWQFWADLSWQLITLLNKPYSVYCVLIQSSDCLLQIIHFNVM